MRSGVASRASLVVLTLTAGVAVLALTFIGLTWSTPRGEFLTSSISSVLFVLAGTSLAVVGAVICASRPGNLIGWLLLFGGLLTSADILALRYVAYVLVERPDSGLPDLPFLASIAPSMWLTSAACILMLLFIFPSGRISTPGASVAVALIPALAVASLALRAIEPGPLPAPIEDRENVLGIGQAEGIVRLAGLLVGATVLLGLAGMVDMVRRYQVSVGDEREQFKWFAYVAAWVPVLMLLWGITLALAPDQVDIIALLLPILLGIIPIAIGVAVLKYRLYDIDILINRTLVYVPLTAIVAGLYVALTGLFRVVFTEATNLGSDAAIAISTLAVVAALTPLKNQLQTLVDRHFKEQPDPLRELRRIATEARSVLQVMDLNSLLSRLLNGARIGLDAEGAALVLQEQRPLLTSGSWNGDAALSVPLIHDGREVGMLLFGHRRNGTAFTAADERALTETAEALALALTLAPARSSVSQCNYPDSERANHEEAAEER